MAMAIIQSDYCFLKAKLLEQIEKSGLLRLVE